jgi:hypothetical protein
MTKSKSPKAACSHQGTRGKSTHDKYSIAICAVLVGFGILIIAASHGFFMSLLGAGTTAAGGSAAYLIVSHRSDIRKNRRREPAPSPLIVGMVPRSMISRAR